MSRSVYFPNLDGLRTLACLGVFFFHTLFLYAFMWTSHDAPVYRYGLSLLGHGAEGVNFFFVLSGFLITYLLLHEEHTTGRINTPAFYLRRVLRIWPLYFASVVFGFVIVPFWMHLAHAPWHETADPRLFVAFLANLDLFRHHDLPPSAFNLAVLWSVSVEEQFYLLWPLLLAGLFRWWRPGAFLLVIGFSLWFRYTHVHYDAMLYSHTFSVIGDLAVGGAVGWVCFRYPAFCHWVGRWPLWAIVVGYAGGAALLVLQKEWGTDAFNITCQRLFRALFFAFVILEQNYAPRSIVKVGRIRWLTYWGTFTYGLYCLHPIASMLVGFSLDRLGFHHSLSTVLLLTALSLPLSAALAWLSYHYLEHPFLKLKNRRWKAPVSSESEAAGETPLLAATEH
ncbi:acyltransferase [Hymenobacter busanensis]|uniref:Acyltransferase n=1 Tax=Hymenobacter busanensis TaxID=2607656 RepID=A0A7L5A2V5_9BACT|nr:acyltransferase [Hymenobacter busanensis]KAA9333183.1 acyltransferase [Hymenobacter busanensis]QHJ08140.1 acyltransferase family protein [Hymenobacter busanensis]